MAPDPLPLIQTNREELQEVLQELLGSVNVYFQPPSATVLQYPAIVYNLDFKTIIHADNNPFRIANRYQITTIDRSAKGLVSDKIAHMQSANFVRSFISDGLYHDIYTIYF